MTRLRDLLRREPKPGLALPAWLDRLLSAGIVTRDPQLMRRQRCVNVVSYATAVSSASTVSVNWLPVIRRLMTSGSAMIALAWGFEVVFGCAALAYAVALMAARSGPQIGATETDTAVTASGSAEQTPRR